MPYLIVCTYKPGPERITADLVTRHVEHFVRNLPHVLIGGQLRSGDGSTPLGAMFVLDYEALEDVNRFLRDDPYHQQDVFSSVTVQRFHLMIPEKEPGDLLRLVTR